MAGEWLKFECSLPEKPEVLAMTVAMGWDDPDLTVGKLMRLFRWFDQHTVDGNASGVTAALLDRLIGVTGFVQAVADTGWLVIDDKGLTLHNFDRHNGATAKSRALTAKRVANHRGGADGNAPSNAATVTAALAREEKRRKEEEKEKESAPKAPPFDPLAVDLPSWLPAETWQRWVKHRGSIRKPIKTPDTVAACFKSLEAFVREGVSVESVVTHAIASGNQGLYAPPRIRGHGPPAGSDRKSRQLETAALMTGATRAEQPPEFIDVPSRLIPS